MDAADRLVTDLMTFVTSTLDAAERTWLSGLQVPDTLGGFRGPVDSHVELAYVLRLLLGAGVEEVGGRSCVAALVDTLECVGRRSDDALSPFSTYRLIEAVADGSWSDHRDVLGALPVESRQRLQVLAMCDAAFAGLDDRSLPRNYVAVRARVAHARARAGLAPSESALEPIALLRRALEADGGWLDDSWTHQARVDVYALDVLLFACPFAARLGPVWAESVRSASDFVDVIGDADGASVTWGRSIGALSLCHSIELAAVAVAACLCDEDRALARAHRALRALDGWFTDGLVTAHLHRSPYGYRGPGRRVQMTFDLLGKLLEAASVLAARMPSSVGSSRLERRPPTSTVEELVELGTSGAAVWVHRGDDLSVVVPFVGATLPDYLPAPRWPGVFDVPVEVDVPTGVPVLWRDGHSYVPAGVPASIALEDGVLTARWEQFVRSGELEPSGEDVLVASRVASFRVSDGRLVVDEAVALGEDVAAVSLQVAECVGRPLAFSIECGDPIRTWRTRTDGMRDMRSYWSEFSAVHEVHLEPSPHLRFRWEVGPKLRVGSSMRNHAYNRALYDAIAADAADVQIPLSSLVDADEAAHFLKTVDVLHMHWPEWLIGPDPGHHERFIDIVRRSCTPIVWTQHNLVPHRKDDRYIDVYRLWAAAADGVVHHSRWGETVARSHLDFDADAVHSVIPHGPFERATTATTDRAAIEREMGMPPCALRFGIVGAPRVEKDVQGVLDAFATTRRADIQLLVLSLRGDERVPDDPRIHAFRYKQVPRDVYDARLATVDALVLPFASEGGMLATGTVGDALGHGIPALVSDWPFLSESLGEGAIPFGSSRHELAAVLETVSRADLARARAAMEARRRELCWTSLGPRTLSLLREVVIRSRG